MKCSVCYKILDNMNGLGKHLYHSHKEISKEEYYKKYINHVSDTCICGNKKKFRGLGEGYREYCSVQCRSNHVEPSKFWKGKVQPKSMVENRVRNTDQKAKEKTRKLSMLKRYGVDNPSKIESVKEKISKSNTGNKSPRKIGQQKKIIDSKRKNGTLNHSNATKEKIRNSVRLVYESEDPPITISENNIKNHKTGYFDGMFYRSSYELKFLEHCKKNQICVISAENKKFRLPYYVDNSRKWYYPDFYLEKYDAVVEIKPNSMLTNEQVVSKIHVGMQNYRFFVVDEEVLEDLDEFFEELENEYLHFVE